MLFRSSTVSTLDRARYATLQSELLRRLHSNQLAPEQVMRLAFCFGLHRRTGRYSPVNMLKQNSIEQNQQLFALIFQYAAPK